QAFIDFARENLDSLVEKAIAETDEAERQKLYEEIQTIAYEDALGITLYQPLEIYPMRDWVKGWEFNPMRSGEVNWEGVYKEE
ncbi:MAG TPA: ABC transporter substrate-binding protein, partial [Candidatus Atribacteria bacterium]|nr:ABC transporter substrate-binding protein [Candidatus Atribacteria bacterium]